MPVPEEDIVCRFVRSKDWNKPERRPKAGAFKGIDLPLAGLPLCEQSEQGWAGVPAAAERIGCHHWMPTGFEGVAA